MAWEGKRGTVVFDSLFSAIFIDTICMLQKDQGFDRGQFHKQVAVMRGQVRL